MKQAVFERQHQADWQEFATRLDALESGKPRSEQTGTFPAAYRRLCQQLTLAESRGYSSQLIEQLRQLACGAINNSIAIAVRCSVDCWVSSAAVSPARCVHNGAMFWPSARRRR